MKKSMILITTFGLICTLIFGCTNPAMPSAVAERLEYSLNALQNTIKNWDTIDNSYLQNPDISPVISTGAAVISIAPPAKNSLGKLVTVSLNLMPNVETAETVDHNQASAYNNANYETGLQNNQIINTNLHNFENNFQSAETNSDNVENLHKENSNFQNLESNRQNTENNAINVENDTENVQNTTQNVNNDTQNIENDAQSENLHFEEKESSLQNLTPSQSVKPLGNGALTYTPRRVNNNLLNKNDRALESYISKVNNLYTMTNDTVEANNLLEESKLTLNDCITELRELAIKMKEGNYTPSAQQITALNNYIKEIRGTITKIRGTNGHLNNEINKINNHDKEGLTTSIDVLNSNYIRILNHIDVRITYLKNALATLEQVKSLLLEAQMLDALELEGAQNDLVNNEFIYNDFDDDYLVGDNDFELPSNDDNYNENNENFENNYEPQYPMNNSGTTNVEHNSNENDAQLIYDTEKESGNKIENITENFQNNNENTTFKHNNEQLIETESEKEIFNNTNDVVINNDNLNDAGVKLPTNDYENTAIKPVDPIIVSDELHGQSQTNAEQTGRVNYEIANEVVQDNINIDTYDNANVTQSNEILNRQRAMRNVDTYNSPQINSRKRNDGLENNNVENANQDVLNNNNLNNNSQGATAPNTALPNNGGMVNGGLANNGGMANGGLANNGGLGGGMTQNDINTPGGTFQNGIITQNNLNEGVNNGVNGVRTGYSGSTNSPYTLDSDGKMRNINTYGHNTLIDIINRGTVNNGINTLRLAPYGTSAADKPNMVNSNEINPQAYMALNPTYVEKVLA